MIIDMGCDDAPGQPAKRRTREAPKGSEMDIEADIDKVRALAESKQDAATGVLEERTLRSGTRI